MTVQRWVKATRLFGWLLAAAVAGLCLGLYPLLEWYQTLRPLGLHAAAAIFFGYYLCVPAVLTALWNMDRLLGNILRGRAFVEENVRRIGRVCWCCAVVAVISLAAGWFYQPLLFLTTIMAFLSLTVSVVRSVMGAAVQMREENDLTV